MQPVGSPISVEITGTPSWRKSKRFLGRGVGPGGKKPRAKRSKTPRKQLIPKRMTKSSRKMDYKTGESLRKKRRVKRALQEIRKYQGWEKAIWELDKDTNKPQTDRETGLKPWPLEIKGSCTKEATGLLIPKATFKRLVREVATEHSSKIRLSSEALEGLQIGSEDHLVGLFQDCNILAMHAKRVTVNHKDIKLASQLRGDDMPFNIHFWKYKHNTHNTHCFSDDVDFNREDGVIGGRRNYRWCGY